MASSVLNTARATIEWLAQMADALLAQSSMDRLNRPPTNVS